MSNLPPIPEAIPAHKCIRIDHLKLENFRCFKEISINFHKDLTIIVAENGEGKTAILDAVAIAWIRFVHGLEGLPQSYGFSHEDIRRVLDASGGMVSIPPVRFTAMGALDMEYLCRAIRKNHPGGILDYPWSRELASDKPKARTTYTDAVWLNSCATILRKRMQRSAEVRDFPSPIFPVFAYYGTGRLFEAHKLMARKKSKPDTSRTSGYTDCLSSSSRYKYFVDWFARFSRDAASEVIKKEPSIHNPKQRLEVVNKAVSTLLAPTGWRSLEWDDVEERVYARHDKLGRHPVDDLSDGIRNMIGLVSDLAHRIARLNPQLGNRAAELTPGVVLIDEVDMHLHPSWQQTVLASLREAFPAVQLIVTTHSPQVLTTVSKECIRVISCDAEGKGDAKEPDFSPIAQSSADALSKVMHVNTHPFAAAAPDSLIGRIYQDAREYEKLVRAGYKDSAEAVSLRLRLTQVGYEIPEADVHLWEFLSKNAHGA